MEEKKICINCKEVKKLNDFVLRNKKNNNYKNICKSCNAEQQKNKRKNNPEKYKEYDKQRYQKFKNPELVTKIVVDESVLTEKLCKKCFLIKSIDNFYWRTDSKKYRNECFDCFHKCFQRQTKKEKYPIINNEKQCSKCFKSRNIELFEFRKDNNKYRSYCKICDNFNRIKNKNFSFDEYENKFLEKEKYYNNIVKKCSICSLINFKTEFKGTRCNNCVKFLDCEKRQMQSHRKCFKCKKIKDIINFKRNFLSRRLSFKRICNNCVILNKEYKKEYHKIWILNNYESQKRVRKKYYNKNRDNILKNERKWRLNHIEYERDRSKKYYINNKDKIKIKRRLCVRLKRKLDPKYRIYQNISRAIRSIIKKNNNPWITFLNYSAEDLKNHLMNHPEREPWMNWENYGIYNSKTWDDNDSSTWTWQIDHIIPQSLFKYTTLEDEDFKKCWSLSNLRPYSSKKNFIDGVTRIRHKNGL